jgi:mRNA-degrading endonuclease RelE of RelBE toxin-antitoxin system
MADVVYEREARGQYERLPPAIKARVQEIALRLAKWPVVSGAKPLRGKLAGRYRIRTGDYRVLFHVDGETVVIEKIGHRSQFYRE